jgi:hypothetical protein
MSLLQLFLCFSLIICIVECNQRKCFDRPPPLFRTRRKSSQKSLFREGEYIVPYDWEVSYFQSDSQFKDFVNNVSCMCMRVCRWLVVIYFEMTSNFVFSIYKLFLFNSLSVY